MLVIETRVSYCMACILLCVYDIVKWGSLHNSDIYRMKTKTGTNVSTFIYYVQALRYVFRPFLDHHQASHKYINTSSCVELL
jgi:hypothetical protein